jgi:hypothetical protein
MTLLDVLSIAFVIAIACDVAAVICMVVWMARNW